LDVSNREQAKQMVKITLEKYGKIDVLINNAGIVQDAFLSKMTENSGIRLSTSILKESLIAARLWLKS